ncbi:YhfC family intramembrane metalloprotease [Clostridium rectalis]|uniref:YhfC family intramembrane metalloprotease n=1 Tax=Clostridium rectalis TaxID=2040295 RepID=UPI000F636F14|nr:YhfC family glutamic-type intramembrane protease [Clostridium rectalis]
MNISVFVSIIGILITSILPVMISAILIKKYGSSWKVFAIGACVFFITQPLLRIPILKYLQFKPWFYSFIVTNFILYSILLGITAGIFEEVGRYIAFKLLLKNNLKWQDGVIFGLGYGGIEAFLFLGISCILNFYTLNPSTLALGIIERIGAMIIHIGMTMLVLYSVKYNNKKYLFYAIGFHTFVDAPIGIFQKANVSLILIESYVLIMAAIAMLILLKIKKSIDKEGILYE